MENNKLVLFTGSCTSHCSRSRCSRCRGCGCGSVILVIFVVIIRRRDREEVVQIEGQISLENHGSDSFDVIHWECEVDIDLREEECVNSIGKIFINFSYCESTRGRKREKPSLSGMRNKGLFKFENFFRII